MRVVKPVSVTDSVLTSSSVSATSVQAWSSSTTYAAAAKVQVGTRVYQSLQAGNTNKPPADAANEAWWTDVGPTNRWAMFDSEVNTQTTVTTTAGADASIVVTLAPGLVNSIALLELMGNTVTVEVYESASASSPVYAATRSLEYSDITDWYEYFFGPTVKATQVHLEDLPPYSGGVIKVTIAGKSEVRCGALVVGNVLELGRTRYGGSLGINDYSRKATNDFGVTTLVKRAYSRRATFSLIVDTRYIDRVYRTLSELRSTPCLWIGIEAEMYTPTVIFGFYKEFSLDLALPGTNYCSIQIEGMI